MEMKIKDREFRILLGLEIMLLVGIVIGITSLNPDKAEAYRLFEFLGADLAAIITTYGIYKMRNLT